MKLTNKQRRKSVDSNRPTIDGDVNFPGQTSLNFKTETHKPVLLVPRKAEETL